MLYVYNSQGKVSWTHVNHVNLLGGKHDTVHFFVVKSKIRGIHPTHAML